MNSPAPASPAGPEVRTHVRNLAIIAHIDHGKTTLIDAILRECHVFRDNETVQVRVMDSNDQERERGITIFAKCASVRWHGLDLNIVDTPGHADFSGEVERTLGMVDGCLLLVDANEGPMPQTRYVLRRALALGLRPIVVLNKADRAAADPDRALDRVFDLFLELGASDAQADFPHIYASALEGWAVREMRDERRGLTPLFETIRAHIPPPAGNPAAPFQTQIAMLDWSEYLGRLFGGRVLRGTVRRGETLVRLSVAGGEPERFTVTKIWGSQGLKRQEREVASAGDILFFAGMDDVTIGDTLCHPEAAEALPPLQIDEPTVAMTFMPNASPFAGREGKAVTINQIRERLQRETRTNVALRLRDLGQEGIEVAGRGELHLSVLIETIRREGWELAVTRPRVIFHEDPDGRLLEPIESLSIDVPEEHLGAVMEKIAARKADIGHMEHGEDGRVRLEAAIPTRGLVGYRSEFLTDTRGTGILASRFLEYRPHRGEVTHRTRGSLVAMEPGKSTAHALDNLQDRAVMFIGPGEDVYEGQVVGENTRDNDMVVNPCKRKQQTNMRAAGSDDTVLLTPPKRLTLEQAIEWIADDEVVEVTPKAIRLRKRVLRESDRKRLQHEANRAARGAD
ncbi:MAG: translational GTPase TypA [Candidatus Sumerlaeia bacterium]|nr:translational GTPase TypA [Candidatus Sumerlaeia bacterium]